jgi:hypothetical protein
MSAIQRVTAFLAFLIWSFTTALVAGQLVGDNRPSPPTAPGLWRETGKPMGDGAGGHHHGLGPRRAFTTLASGPGIT